MKLQVSIALALLSGAALANDHDDRYRDGREHWRRAEDRRVVEHMRWDRDHRRYWEGGRWVTDEVVVDRPVYHDELYSLNLAIGDLDLQISELRDRHWFRGRDERIRDLCVRRDHDRDRVAFLRGG